ncbi:MAG: sensory box histidine kinase/response regulator [Fibrobacteres bacterium]|nr:sensory box histidine kinase/response regulator [Fibrobacterota bacterium]
MTDAVTTRIPPALQGGGEMGSLLRSMDWGKTPIGPISGWPSSLVSAASIMLNSGLPMHIMVGPERILLVNDASLPTWGDKHPTAMGRKAAEVWHEVWHIRLPQLETVRRTGKPTWYENLPFSVLRHGFLEETYFSLSDSPILDEAGGFTGTLTCVTETTPLVIGQRRLNFFRSFTERSPVGKTLEETAREISGRLEGELLDIPFSLLYLLDERGNKARLAAASGLDREGSDPMATVDCPASEASAEGSPLARALGTGQPVLVGNPGVLFRFRQGSNAAWPEAPREALVFPLKGSPGNPCFGLLVLGVSPRLPLDRAFREHLAQVADRISKALAETVIFAETDQQRAWLHALFMQAPALICILRGPEHVFAFANPPYYDLVNRTDLIGKPIKEALPELDGQPILEILDGVYGGVPFTTQEEKVMVDRGGGLEPHYFRLNYQPMRNAQGEIEGILVFGLDVTIQVLARQKAEESSADLAAQKRILEAIARREPLPNVLETVTRNAETIFPEAKAAVFLVASDGRRLLTGAAPRLHPDHRRDIEAETIGKDAGICGTSAFSGARVIAPDIAADPKWDAQGDRTLAHGFKACWCLPVISHSGRIAAVFALFFREPREADPGELTRLEILKRTASLAIERRVSEESLREAQDQLLQAQKMESIGKLAGGIAHDFNNLLTAINGYSELSLGMIERDSPLQEYLSEIKNAGARAADLTRQLLAYSRKQVLSSKVVDLNALIKDLGKMLKRIIGEQIELDLDLDPDLRTIKVDPGKIEQVVLNLAVNARDAIPAGGRITIRTRSLALPRDAPKDSKSLSPGAYAMLAVQDTGTGMSAEVKAHAFEPFFTTKAFGKGSGLGLSTVYGIIAQSGGRIFLESEEGAGSTFSMYFPVAEGADPEAPVSAVRRGPYMAGATILLVEDETAVRRLVRQVLADQGYTVLEGEDGAAGLEMGRDHPGPIDLVITDVVMPRMDGVQMIRHLRALRPDIRVLFISGYAETPVVQDGIAAGDSHFIQKPFLPHAILDEVRALLQTGLPTA